ncbi:TIGR03087 family PEP-CTERM/XrtA system glycosyltransferase [Novosphingobium sp. Gsoil 351]|uniref:TIGR03087 family PEP-CTERM/XrtA system glycosyltransferase n=1 Tax=Novosphingobium sp. Gsoil 351 TaxID=2675225 RepID=UPI001E4A3C1D|nr:TIGR03087 family PEP-CTERM/XrtA system glycosyltransferase [Novosphingobium sp. Gsoil 351]
MTGEVLFLAHRIPFPPDRGDKIRSHHILKALARLAPVHVGTFADDDQDRDAEAELALTAASYHVARRTKPLAIAGLQALATRRPVSLPAFADSALRAFVRRTVAARPIVTIYAFSSQMAQYIPAGFRGRVVIDFVDVDSAKFEAYAAQADRPLKTIYAREARLLRTYEAEAAKRADLSLLVTDEEAALFRSRLDPATRGACDVRSLGNGIDCSAFSATFVDRAPELAQPGGPHLLFTGQMDYPPNVAAVVRFASRIMPAIRERRPEARFHIVGREPAAAVIALDGRTGTSVWGRVEDTRPWLAGADLVVAPLEIARGVQNKVLEAMAMGRPVLVSPGAATGIAAREGVHLAIADSDAAFIASALALLAAPQACAAMGFAARQFVSDHQSWPAMLADLPEIAGVRPAGIRDAA